jgi:glycosyltransferase involved in cell wall biosynthesis
MTDLKQLLAQIGHFQPQYLDNSAWTGHLPFAGWLIESKKPHILVELGTHGGSSYFSFCQAIAENGLAARCFAVDTWGGDDHAGHYEKSIFEKVRLHNEKNYASFSTLLKKTFDEALLDIKDQSVDLLHIDGLHTYEAVKHDFETWLPKLAPGAVVLFHDTMVKEGDFGVWRFWAEIKSRYPLHFEMSHSFGLGVIQVSPASADETLPWLLEDLDFKTHLSSSFAAWGQFQIDRYERTLTLQHITNLEEAIASKDNAWSLKSQEFNELKTSFDELRHDHETLSHQHSSLHHHHETLKHQHTALHLELQQAYTTLHSAFSSISWQITQPLRYLGRAVRKVRSYFRFFHLFHLLHRLVASKGGYWALSRKALFVLRKDGVEGLLFKINWTLSPQHHQAAPKSDQHDRNDYSYWVQKYDTLSDEERSAYKKQVNTWTQKPLISVVMPTYNSPLPFLRQAIESLEVQIYPHWELCIADDCSTQAEVRQLLKEKCALDARIKVCFREQNGHISAASNSALELVSGDWVALFDHDDLLTEDALFFVARHIIKHPEAQIIYSDEDKINESGERFSPHFKSDWNPELFFTQNYLSHLGVYRTALLRQIGGFRVGLEGSQDHDLALRCLPHIEGSSIHHIPKVLYHWRAISGSTALNASAKSYADDARHKALEDYFESMGTPVTVSPGLIANTAKIHYIIPEPPPLVSLLIPTRDRLELIETCVRSILDKTTYPNFEIIILDNASVEPPTLAFFQTIQNEDPRVSIVRDDRPFNFSAINNLGAQRAKGSILGLINNDIEVIRPEWLTEMVSHTIQKGVGCVGAKLYYPNDTLQHAGVILGIKGVANHSHSKQSKHHDGYFGRLRVPQVLSAVTAACLLVKNEIFLEVGGMNEKDLSVAFNDIDFCLKVRAQGYRNVWTPYAELYHHESLSRGTEDTPEKKARFEREVAYMKDHWGAALLEDPYYNPNLTLDDEDFSLAWGPRAHPFTTMDA